MIFSRVLLVAYGSHLHRSNIRYRRLQILWGNRGLWRWSGLSRVKARIDLLGWTGWKINGLSFKWKSEVLLLYGWQIYYRMFVSGSRFREGGWRGEGWSLKFQGFLKEFSLKFQGVRNEKQYTFWIIPPQFLPWSFLIIPRFFQYHHNHIQPTIKQSSTQTKKKKELKIIFDFVAFLTLT